jgi:hypothetical protein
MRRRPTIPQRRRIFLGCEGESERSYSALLNQVALEERNLHIALDVELLRPGGGDPLALVQLACRLIERKTGQSWTFSSEGNSA